MFNWKSHSPPESRVKTHTRQLCKKTTTSRTCVHAIISSSRQRREVKGHVVERIDDRASLTMSGNGLPDRTSGRSLPGEVELARVGVVRLQDRGKSLDVGALKRYSDRLIEVKLARAVGLLCWIKSYFQEVKISSILVFFTR